MIMFSVGFCVGVAIERLFPAPITYVLTKAKALWDKVTAKYSA